MQPQIKLSKTQVIDIHSDTNLKFLLIYMRVQVHSSSELPLGHNENQKSLSNQSCLWSYLTSLRVKGILCSFSLDINKKQGKDIPESSTLEILQKISTENFLIRCRGQHLRLIKWRRYIRFSFVENSINKFVLTLKVSAKW